MASQDENQEDKSGTPCFRKMMGEKMEMVDLYVGPNKVHFSVHKELLCNKIPYFDKMFKGTFQEAAVNSATFPEDLPETFDLLVEWVYSGTIRPLTMIPGPDPQQPSAYRLSYPCTQFYSLADKICMPELIDLIMSRFHQVWREWRFLPSLNSITETYSTTSEDSPMRRFMCMSYYYMASHGHEEHWPAESVSRALLEIDGLAADLIRLTRQTKGAVYHPSQISACNFHCHDKTAPCALRGNEMPVGFAAAPGYFGGSGHSFGVGIQVNMW